MPLGVPARRRWPLVATTSALVAAYFSTSFLLNSDAGVANDTRKAPATLMNAAQVSAALREHQESYLVERQNGVLRYDLAQLPSNNPIEDDHSEGIVHVPLVTPQDEEYATDWMFWGVYDGHAGWSTSTKLREALIPAVTKELDAVYKPVVEGSTRRLAPAPEVIDSALKTAFVKLDDEIVNQTVRRLLANPTKKSAIDAIPPALSGSCALLAFYDTATAELRVAVAGDSRAVLGTRTRDGSWKARALTTDQTGSNEDEVRRIRAEHPGEEATVVRNGRLLGYEPTRAFGDARLKWPRDVQHQLARDFFGRSAPPDLRTPPYMTAEPVVTRTRIDPETPSFLVLASDGLYELLSNEEVVSLVVDWMNKERPSSIQGLVQPGKQASGGWLPGWLGGGGDAGAARQVRVVEDVSSNKDAQKQPIRRGRVPFEMTVQDTNAGTHIMRNALGGGNQEFLSMMLSIPSPMSRRYRDDLTVTVVFFGENAENTGKVRVNTEATEQPPKAKL